MNTTTTAPAHTPKPHNDISTMSYSNHQTQSTQRNIQAIRANGHRIDPSSTVRAWSVPATSEFPAAATGGQRPTHMWLEQGNARAGLAHMQTNMKIKSFTGAGILPAQQPQKLPVLVEAHTTVGRHIGFQGKDAGRPIMSTYIDGGVQRSAVTVGSNGFVVGMNPVSSTSLARRSNGPREVSDRTMERLYSYPPNRPSRRNTELISGTPRTMPISRAKTLNM